MTDTKLRINPETGRADLLNSDEERALKKRIDQGDQTALLQLIEANMGLVIAKANAYRGLGLDKEDLESEGKIGLIKAIECFDPNKGNFFKHALLHIKKTIILALCHQSRDVRLNPNIIHKITKLKRIKDQIEHNLGRQATEEDIAEELGLPAERIHFLLSIGQKPVSFDEPSYEGSTSTYGDHFADPTGTSPSEAADRHDRFEKLEYLFSFLSP